MDIVPIGFESNGVAEEEIMLSIEDDGGGGAEQSASSTSFFVDTSPPSLGSLIINVVSIGIII